MDHQDETITPKQNKTNNIINKNNKQQLFPSILLTSPPDQPSTTRIMNAFTREPIPMPNVNEIDLEKKLNPPPNFERQESFLPPALQETNDIIETVLLEENKKKDDEKEKRS